MPHRERTYRTEAIVMRRKDIGEADRILTLLTPGRGKLRAIAKGIRKPRSRKAGHLELFTRSKLLLASGRDLDIITQAEVVDAYRPVRATLAMVDWTERVNRPDLLKDGYIASRSRHNLGLAIDLTLIETATGRELEMGTPFDTFSAAAHTANASGTAAANRQILKAAMEREGFVNYDQEWWHFSFNVGNPLRFDRPIQ